VSAGQFKGKVAIVTGGGSGIGRATSLAFGREGAHVAVADIAGDKAQAVASEIVKAGGSALPITVDVGDSASVKAMIDAAVARFGRLDILFNNAGISGFTGKTLTEVDEEVFDAVMRVNVKGVWLGMKLGIPAMLKNGGGCIVNTASTLGWIGQKFSTTYGGSKHAVIGLTKSTSIEYGLKYQTCTKNAPVSTIASTIRRNSHFNQIRIAVLLRGMRSLAEQAMPAPRAEGHDRRENSRFTDFEDRFHDFSMLPARCAQTSRLA